ncbi:4a-hydroxytetrahydrobiopterin dehydratase [Cohnella nanjingensis]|uniref:4a-hydroxytetrahydrobiopterin dehydratase n=1 Tax=Cohnella nanjingensis TaxID=1387779 RepID=A0A7X0RMM6_9BACL|nr:4a-hydroxytetrahydrobiopterin dehydratase [Cohnella nanjingensis]MBB6670319.1 4a-hydroxytetrahydrobiopterin dehydratase [Cohnella nanjingensis]
MGTPERLTESEWKVALAELGNWSVEEGKWLIRKVMFPSFPAAIEYVRQVAAIAEADDHHPFIAIDYRKVTLKLTTWHAGGLTRLDFASAKAYEALLKRD